MSDQRAFFDVEQSLTGRRWVQHMSLPQQRAAEIMKDDFGIDESIARVLAARGVAADEATAFVTPTLRDLMPDPSSLTDMDTAAARIAKAITAGEKVTVFGDYDVDGATASALLARYFAACGLEADIYIPDRIFEGYGPNPVAIKAIAEAGTSLLVCVDCGSTSHESLALSAQLGLDAVVIDHHQLGDELPVSLALVNPNRHDDLSGQGHLCAAGVVFLVLVALNRHLRGSGFFSSARGEPDLMALLDLVALGTVCDVVPLIGLNRAYVMRGLEVMRKLGNAGLTALARVARQDGPAAPWHLGFLLGPRINAGGRIGDAALGARLLTCDDPEEAEEIAAKLDMLNTERQRMESDMLEAAVAEAEAEIGQGDGPAVLVTAADDWHAGIVGLLASRLKDRFRRPAIAISFSQGDPGQGSARSISGVNIGEAVRDAVSEGLAVKGGGHAMAAGLTIERAKLGAFRAFLEDRFGSKVTELRREEILKIDAALGARAATPEFFDKLEKAGPFGAGHPPPVFVFPHHVIRFSDRVGRDHVRFSLGSPDGTELRGIAFRCADDPLGQTLLQGRGERAHAVGQLSADFYRGTRRVQLRLTDLALVPKRV